MNIDDIARDIRKFAEIAGIPDYDKLTVSLAGPDHQGQYTARAEGWPWPSGREGYIEDSYDNQRVALELLRARARRLAQRTTEVEPLNEEAEVTRCVQALCAAVKKHVEARTLYERRLELFAPFAKE